MSHVPWNIEKKQDSVTATGTLKLKCGHQFVSTAEKPTEEAAKEEAAKPIRFWCKEHTC